MKLLSTASVILVLVASAFCQTPGRVQTATRLVVLFSNLENQLNRALASDNQERAAAMVTDDFSQWTPQPPGAPIPRDKWLKSGTRALSNARILQMAAKDIGDHAVADFVLLSGDKAFFIVDLWQKQGSEWKLQQRYEANIDATPYRHPVRPTGKD